MAAAITKGDEFAELGQRPYVEQAVWFLNGFWEVPVPVVTLNEDHEVVSSVDKPLKEDAETVWAVTQRFIELDDRKDGGNELDEFKSHQLLEKFAQAMTVIEMREALREIDVDSNGQMSLIEYLVFRYKKGVDETVDSPQGENEEEVAKAQAVVEEVQHALTEVMAGLEAQRVAAAELKQAEEELRKQQAAVEAAEAEQEGAVAELHAQEEAYHGAIAKLEATVSNESLGVVKKNKAAAELAQLKAEDPLPLSRAKITNEAALRKVQKQRRIAEQKTAECEAKVAEAEAKAAELEVKTDELMEKMEEAKAELEIVKKQGGVAQGNIWWMEREIEEAEKYLPKSKQRK